jgi:hypothetical protein
MPLCASVALCVRARDPSPAIGATDRFHVAHAPVIGATDHFAAKRGLPSPKPVDSIGAADHSRVRHPESIGATDQRAVERRPVRTAGG